MMKRLTILALSVVTALSAVPAAADNNNGFGVATAAVAVNVFSQDKYVSTFRTGANASGSFTNPGDAPSLTINGCNYPGGADITCSGSATGTAGSNFNLTASNSNATLTDDLGGRPKTVRTGTASARADLATGEVGVTAFSDGFRTERSGASFVAAQSSAQFNDTLNFTVAGAGPGSLTNIGVGFVLDGSLLQLDARSSGFIDERFSFGSANARYVDGFGVVPFNQAAGWVSSAWDFSRPGEVRFTGIYALSGASESIGLSKQLIAFANGGLSVMFGSTSKLFLDLPTNVSFVSNSGVLLQGNAGAVPEPASWAMLISGFGLVGAVARRRRITVAA
jgi:hypothetical protein